MPYLTKDMTLDEAEHEMRHFRMPDLDGRRRYVVETGKVEACLTFMEHGYELDRTEPYLCLSRPTDNGFGTTWGVELPVTESEPEVEFLAKLQRLAENWRYSDEYIGIVVRARWSKDYERKGDE